LLNQTIYEDINKKLFIFKKSIKITLLIKPMGEVKYEKILINNKIIIKRIFKGSITVQEVIDSFKYMLKNESLKDCKNTYIVTDVTKAKLNFNMFEFRKVISFIKKNKMLSCINLSVVVDSPSKTVFPTIASTIIGIRVKPFSSVEAAIQWAEFN
jgi:hypothetical protein